MFANQRQAGIACAWLIVATGFAVAGQETLPELAKRLRQPIYKERIAQLLPARFERLAAQADIIVVGKTEPLGVSLSDDKQALFTDYRLTPISILLEKRQRPPDEASQPIIIRRWGGNTVFDGISVVMKQHEAPIFEQVPVVLVWLEREQGAARYRLVNEVLAVADATDNVIHLLAPAVYYESDDTWARVNGAGIDVFQAELRRIGK